MTGNSQDSASSYIAYKHETYMCETCCGYGNIESRTERGGVSFVRSITCHECHGIGCVGDKGERVAIVRASTAKERIRKLKEIMALPEPEREAALLEREKQSRVRSKVQIGRVHFKRKPR